MQEEDQVGREIVVVGKECVISEALVCTYVAGYGHNCVNFHLRIGQAVAPVAYLFGVQFFELRQGEIRGRGAMALLGSSGYTDLALCTKKTMCWQSCLFGENAVSCWQVGGYMSFRCTTNTGSHTLPQTNDRSAGCGSHWPCCSSGRSILHHFVVTITFASPPRCVADCRLASQYPVPD